MGDLRLRRKETAQRWRRGMVLAVAACLVALAANAWFAEITPGNWWGLTYGALAALLMVAVGAFGVRRRSMKTATRLGAGRASSWLAFHLYGGLLFALLVLMHTGFRFPTGWVTGWLWGLSLWTVVSGLVGRGLQKWIPKLLASGLTTEVLYERIPELVDEIGKRALAIAEASEASEGSGHSNDSADSDGALRALYERSLAPELSAPRRRWIYFLDVTGGIQAKLREFEFLRPLLADAEAEKLDELERLYRTKLEIDAHYTLQQPLRWWLYLHLPVSLVLFVLLALHLYTVFVY